MKRLFAVIPILFICFALNAQDRRWDSALDQYQQICEECISIRSRYASGEAVQAASVASLLSRLANLRNTLKEAEGQMTPAQRLRFEAIRLRYEEVFGTPRSTFLLPSLPALSSVSESQNLPGLNPPHYVSPSNRRPAKYVQPGTPQFGFLFYTGVPDLYCGTVITLSFADQLFGIFAKADVSIPYVRGEYECLSDGTTAGGFIWTSGDESLSRWSVTAGITVTPSQLISIYAGGGYGSRNVLWQDISGRWATVSDRSLTGFSADAGIIFNLNRFSIIAGVSTIGINNVSAELGLGIRF